MCPNCGYEQGSKGFYCKQQMCPMKSFVSFSLVLGNGYVKQGGWTGKEGGKVVEV